MKATRIILLFGILALAAAGPSPAGNPREQAALASQHLSGIALVRRWADALYHFIPPESDERCEPSVTPFVDNGDGTFSQDIVTFDCIKIHVTNYGGSPSDYDLAFEYPDGTTETLQARTTETFFNGGPKVVHFVHEISTGERIVYDEELQLEPALDESGNPIENLNFWYALVTRGTAQLASGERQSFELLQTKAFDCTNIFTGQPIPEAECDRWFDVNEELGGIRVPKPDRLTVRLLGAKKGATGGTFALQVPVSDPSFSIADLTKDATGRIVLNGRQISFRLVSNRAKDPLLARWEGWRTSGRGLSGTFSLKADLAGKGQAFDTTARVTSRGRPVHFIARWDRDGLGPVIVAQQATQPGSPYAGALEFAQMKWSGLAAAFGPAPGL